ncbi:MAG: four helix bundle protein [Patescibacteria group bacterium]|nr:four helix bundle protein [Patescibacteria group bacterium]
MPEKKGFQNLEVWQVCHELMIMVYDFCKLLPAEEKYNRISQLKRSSSSAPANIAEGYGRYYWQEAIQFCRNARGSVEETHNHIIAAQDLGQCSQEDCEELIEHCEKSKALINGYIRFLRKQKKGHSE